jgi:hypothetical protein
MLNTALQALDLATLHACKDVSSSSNLISNLPDITHLTGVEP